MENLEKPYFRFNRPIGASLFTGRLYFRQDLKIKSKATTIVNGVDTLLIQLYQDLATFSTLIDQALRRDDILLNLTEFCEESISIQQNFLFFSSSKIWPEERSVEEALRVGALLYLKGVLKELPSSATGSQVLISELKICLSVKPDPRQHGPLLLWLCFIGCYDSQTESDKSWFLAYLVDLAIILELTEWDDVRGILTRIMWIGAIHEMCFGDIWEAAIASRR